MKQYFFFLTLLFFGSIVFGQSQPSFVFDTANAKSLNNMYYSKTDFSFVDTLDLWNYELDTTYKGKQSDSVKPIGKLIFWRIRPIDDGISKRLYNQLWTPFITFDVFNISDTNYCYEESKRTRYFSSCVPPDVGGDLIKIDKFIFLNHSVCLGCQRHDTKVDYCRPLINYVFSKLDKTGITTIQSLVNRFRISAGQLQKAETRKVFSTE